MQLAERIALGLIWTLALGCEGGGDADPRETAPPPVTPVVASALAELAGELERVSDPDAALEVDPDLLRRAGELSRLAAEANPDFQETARADLTNLDPDGELTAAALAAVVLDGSALDTQRQQALFALRELEHDAGGAQLVGLMKLGGESWIRAYGAWLLGQRAEQHRVPDLILQLRYEKDHETAVWIAWALAQSHCYAGLDALFNVASDSTSAARNQAIERLGEIAAAAGVEDAAELLQAWRDGDQAGVLPETFLEDRTRAVLWRWIQRLDSYQLRPVDDTRFIFERCWSPAADLLAEALFDESSYVRLHATQCLKRMGPRAQRSRWALELGLDLPELAPWSAEALGALGDVGVRPLLEQRLGPDSSPELRVAAARGLGSLALPESLPALRAASESEPFDELAQVLLEAQVYVGAGDQVVESLADYLDREWLEPATSERAIAYLIEQWVAQERAGAEQLLNDWLELASDAERSAKRKQRLESYLASEA